MQKTFNIYCVKKRIEFMRRDITLLFVTLDNVLLAIEIINK